MDEQDIINAAYTLLEQDNTMWNTTDDEYLTAREFLNMGVGRWEHYNNTTWNELWTTLKDNSTGGDTSTSAAVSDYDCPTAMARPGGYVTTGTATHTFWTVKNPNEVAALANNDDYWCYFTGSKKDGFDLHFNPRIVLTAGETIDYPYYKKATTSTATSSVMEMSDPYYLAYFIAAHMSEEGVNADFFNMAEEKLDNMMVENMSGVWGVPNTIDDMSDGFGTAGGATISSSNPTGR